MKNSLKQVAAQLCCFSLVVLSLGAHAQQPSITAPLGEKFKVPNLLVKQQTRLVLYRLATDKNPGAASIYINGAYQASLQRGAFTELCLPPSSIEVSARMVENGQTVHDSYDVTNTLVLEGGKETFVQVFEEVNGHALMMSVRPEKSLPELVKTRAQQHTISRVPEAVACQDAGKPAAPHKPAKKPQTITLGADALFPFGKSDADTIPPKGRALLDDLSKRIKSEFGAADRVHLHIVGHADKFGSTASNMKLSQERAAAIKSYLVKGGLSANNITTEGRGDTEPVVKTCGKELNKANVACNKPNRRVVVEVTATQAAEATN